MWEKIKELLAKVWSFIKKIVLRIVNFVVNIVGFFKDPSRLKKLQENKEVIATILKTKLENGDYQVVNCLFNKEEGALVNPEEDAVVMTAPQIDPTTSGAFGDKEMIVLQ